MANALMRRDYSGEDPADYPMLPNVLWYADLGVRAPCLPVDNASSALFIYSSTVVETTPTYLVGGLRWKLRGWTGTINPDPSSV
jgi:hypothetical protein